MGLEVKPLPAPFAAELSVTRLPAFEDNYLWLVHGLGEHSRRVAAVDPGDADVIREGLRAGGLELAAILVTHHHGDHVGGVAALAHEFGVPVYGPAGEDIPARTVALREGDEVALARLGLHFRILDVPGHTAGHIAYAGHSALFCGDTLFSGGCGRLFEGTPAQMLASLDKLAKLPPETRVYCAHEYTASNLRFARSVEPENAALAAYATEVANMRSRGVATVPTSIGLELRVNPFLRTRLDEVRRAAAAHAGREPHGDADAFGIVREWKNGFRG
ncbi:MAG: hydroxyacylglutathione hydrolase [Proteobacteria bacterium]|nr:hydroxyacylglutathione hydrolase [Pseudomonadota bacterium]